MTVRPDISAIPQNFRKQFSHVWQDEQLIDPLNKPLQKSRLIWVKPGRDFIPLWAKQMYGIIRITFMIKAVYAKL